MKDKNKKKYGFIRLDIDVYNGLVVMAKENNRKIGAQVAEIFKMAQGKK